MPGGLDRSALCYHACARERTAIRRRLDDMRPSLRYFDRDPSTHNKNASVDSPAARRTSKKAVQQGERDSCFVQISLKSVSSG
mmetsp:Transcript_9996/g.20991  ORF Transcript_9996/g.20991 Transcript_9996/m.20991 type:complete len:83 (-) Transcript_9996:303-551(-)